jgi:hypothetical protein
MVAGTHHCPEMNVRFRSELREGFTRTDFIAASVGILVMVFCGWLGIIYLGARTQRRVCQQNIQRIVKAMNGFENLNGQYPSGGKINSETPSDWIHWQVQRRGLSNSSIAAWIPGFNDAKLQCPLDKQIKLRPYQFSYSMHGYCENRARTQIQNPSKTALIVEEEKPNDGYFAEGSAGDKRATRHRGKGFVGFVDEHVELIGPDKLPK